MLIHLRRAVTFAVVALVLTFAYALIGTGVSQLFFKHQANGSITANGSTLIGQNWSATKCPGNLMGSCVFQGRPDDLGPYAANPKATPAVAGGDNPLTASSYNGTVSSGESGASNLGPRSKTLKQNTQALVAYWHQRGSTPLRTWSRPRAAGMTPTSRRPTPRPRYPWSRRAPDYRLRSCRRSSTVRTTARSWASSAAATSTSCSSIKRWPNCGGDHHRHVGDRATGARLRGGTDPRGTGISSTVDAARRRARRRYGHLIILRFMGRAAIPGMSPGRRVGAEGMPSEQGGTLVMLNPHYAFVVDDIVVDDDHAEHSCDDQGGSVHSIERGGGDDLPPLERRRPRPRPNLREMAGHRVDVPFTRM